MKRILPLAMAASMWLATYLPAAAQWNWADDQQQITEGPEYAASKAICRRLRDVKPPASDRPDAATAAALGHSCNAEALYYGIGRPSEPARARQCAFVQRQTGGASPPGHEGFSGTAMLMTIYANGIGAARNLDLATALACQVEGAPAEVDGRVKHLQKLKAEHWTGRDFSFCDDVTSGDAGGLCASHDAAIADARRSERLAHLTDGWPAADRSAFAKLRAAEQAYVKASSGNEVDLTGTLRAALVIHHEQELEEAFVGLLADLEAGKVPALSASAFEAADAELRATYRRLMAGPDPVLGTVTKKGIHTAQRAWLHYRDAWVAFAAVKFPAVSANNLQARLIRERTKQLQALTS